MAELFETPGNPVPENAVVDRLVMRDGFGLRYARFAATGRPLKGTVVILTGRNECIEKYFETIRDLSQRGFGSAIFDLRGQGGSDRLLRDPFRGHIDRFEDYAQDIEPFFEQVVLPDCRGPFYMLAHSTGALVALLAADRLVNRVRRMVLCAPLLAMSGLPFSQQNARRIANALTAVGLGSVYVGGGPPQAEAVPFAANKLTTDFGRYTRNTEIVRRNPQLGLGGPTAAWMRAAFMAMEKVHDPDFRARLAVPMLLVAAGNDEVVSSQAIELYGRNLRCGSMITIDGARHEILQEADIYREQLLAAFDAFVPGSGETGF